ncbi:MAG: Mu-like prophage major head subunit gpT family protein [Rhodospirillaceae bacterium]
MILNRAALDAATTGFRTIFNGAFAGAKNADHYKKIAMLVPSTTAKNSYPWLADNFEIREWVGDRNYQNLVAAVFSIVNKDFEGTVNVPRNAIEDDELGVFGPMFQMMGDATATFPNRMVFPLLKAGFTSLCWDGQYFFDTDHPGFDADGKETSVSNNLGGDGDPWFLIAGDSPLKPLIYQERRKFGFVAKDKPTDDNVFDRKEFVYGVDGRMNVGFGMPQLVVSSRQPLTHDSYAAARAAFGAWHKKSGEPLGLVGNLLVVGGTNEAAARKVLLNETKANGESNEWKGSAELFHTPWL